MCDNEPSSQKVDENHGSEFGVQKVAYFGRCANCPNKYVYELKKKIVDKNIV